MKKHTVVCQDCGFRYDGTQKLCPMCGSKSRRPAEKENTPRPERRSGRQRDPKVIGGIVIITAMILMTLGAGVLLRQMNAPAMEPAPRPEQVEPAVPEGSAVPEAPAEPSAPAVPDKPADPAADQKKLKQQCQAIVDDYSARMREATPRLMEEFKAETEGESDGRVLAHVCNRKIGVLAELCNEGFREIWELLYTYGIDPGHKDYHIYEDYEFRLNLVYEDEAMQISSLYSEYYILHAS